VGYAAVSQRLRLEGGLAPLDLFVLDGAKRCPILGHTPR